jgi:hypothetical protein
MPELVRAGDDRGLAAWLAFLYGDTLCPCEHQWKLCTVTCTASAWAPAGCA